MASNPASSSVHDVEIEQALLGTLLTNNDAFDDVSDMLRAAHFHEPLHQRIYTAVTGLIKLGRVASPAAVGKVLETDEGLRSLGGKDYLVECARFSPTVTNAADFAKLIRDMAMFRGLAGVARDLLGAIDTGVMGETTPDGLVEKVEGELHALVTTGSTEQVQSVTTVFDKAIERAERAYQRPQEVGVSTGLRALDERIGLLVPSDLVVIGGSTSMGKTSLAQQIAWHVAGGRLPFEPPDLVKQRHRTLAFTMEMDDVQYVNRHLAQVSGVHAVRIEMGVRSEAEMVSLMEARAAFQGLPLGIDASPRLTVAQIRSRVRRAKKRGPLSLVLVDHLRFIEPEDRRANERDQLQQITRDLKALAKECGLCVLLVAHLNRESNKREDKTPTLSDLYGSASIEQNADTVVLIHREEYWLDKVRPVDPGPEMSEWTAKKDKCAGKAQLLVPKRRRGPTGSAEVRFDAPFTLFADVTVAPKDEQRGLL